MYIEKETDFVPWVFDFRGKSEMGDLELINLRREKQRGGEVERFIIMVVSWFCFVERGIRRRGLG